VVTTNRLVGDLPREAHLLRAGFRLLSLGLGQGGRYQKKTALVEVMLREVLAVVTAHAGVEGLRMIENVHPELVILDLKLPDLSGA
jgi:CheY-like chemotaxis protein